MTTTVENQSNFFEELITSIRKWLEQKYGVAVVGKIIDSWQAFYMSGTFGDEKTIEKFYAETVSLATIDGSLPNVWACKITEQPPCNPKYVPRKWITEIGYRAISETLADVSYSVKYVDLLEYSGQILPKPAQSIPKVAQFILSSHKWTCSINGRSIIPTLKNYESFDGSLFGIEECRSLVECGGIHPDGHSNISKENEEVKHMDARWISLCKVNRPDKNKDIWMQRLADSVGGVLVAPLFDDSKEQIFDNRPLIFCEDGPSDPDVIGFWEWTERKGDSGRWLSDASYIEHVTPVEIVVLDNFVSIGELIEALKGGIKFPSYIRCQVLVAIKNNGRMEGVLCDLSDLDIRPGEDMFVTLKSNIYTLPYYSLSEDDIFIWRHRKIYKYIPLKEPQKRILIQAIAETIKEMFLQRMNWPIFKAQGITKNDWQKFKQFFAAVPRDSILERLSEIYGMSAQEAQNCVNSFLQTVDNYVEVEDIDSAYIVQMIDNHNGLKLVCDEIAYKKWCTEHKAETDKAEAEVAAIRDKAKQEQDESEKHLLDIKEAISTAEQIRSDVLSDISASQDKLKQLQGEIARYENLGKDALVAVRQRIAEAQKDMAGFIADLSVVLPQSTNYSGSEKRVSLWQYTGATSNSYSDDEIELAENWGDELNAISQSLSFALSVETELCSMFAAFLYSAHIHNVPLLIAGPGGHDIANVLAVSLYADGAGQLTLGNEFDLDGVSGIENCNEHIFSVQNMFGKGWADIIPQTFTKLKKHVVWTHPYVEDMAIEPKGLYNYMIPILSECFVGSIPALEPWPGKRSDNFQAYVSKKKLPLRIAAVKRLGLSKMLLSQLELILSDAKAILDNPSKEKDMELLFGLLPICVLTGKVDILKDVLESEGNLSNSVRAEAERYIEEE